MTVLTYPNIEAERARRGYSKDEFSQLLGVSRKTYYNWVSKGKIPQGKLEQMASIFGTTTEYLLVQNNELAKDPKTA